MPDVQNLSLLPRPPPAFISKDSNRILLSEKCPPPEELVNPPPAALTKFYAYKSGHQYPPDLKRPRVGTTMDFILTKHPMIEVFQCEIKEKDTLYAAFCHSCKTNFAHTAARKLKNHVASSEHERRLNLTDNLTEAEVKEQARRSQERSFSIKLEDEERKLDVNMQAVEKKLSGIVIEKSASSEIFDSNNKENISTTSQVNDSMDVKELA